MLYYQVLAVLLAVPGSVSGFRQKDFFSPPSTDRLADGPAPIVELDYGKYQGYYNETFDLNIYRG